MVRTFLFIMNQPPTRTLRVKEWLDMIMTAAAFEQTVSLLFMDDAVWQLYTGATAVHAPACAELQPVYQALELYDINLLWVERESLLSRGIEPSSLLLPVQLIERSRVPELIRGTDYVLNC